MRPGNRVSIKLHKPITSSPNPAAYGERVDGPSGELELAQRPIDPKSLPASTRPRHRTPGSAGLTVVSMRSVPWWGVISAAAAPVLLIGGWTVAAGLQQHFDPVSGTVSALAAIGATDRWVMNLVFLLVGLCYIATALALRPAKTSGRLILIGGAMSGMLVAANPEHAGGFGSVPHFVWASIGFAGLTLWPLAAAQRGAATPWGPTPWGLRRTPAAAAVAVQFALLAWFGAELILAAHQVGVAERVMGAAQATWPLAVVLSCCLPARTRIPARNPNQTSTV
jgi:hypothetical membrane protein